MSSSPSVEDLQSALAKHGDIPTQRLITILLVQHGVAKPTIADSLDVSLRTIYNWLDRFDREPLETAPFDSPRPGAPSALGPEERQALFRVLQDPPDVVGYPGVSWSPAVVIDYIEDAYGVSYSRRHALRLLRESTSSDRTRIENN